MSFTAAETLSGETNLGTARVALEQRFDRLLATYKAALARLVAGYVRSDGDRDDLLQEIAIHVWQALPQFREECSERTFVFRIAHNRSLTYLARNQSRAAAVEPEGFDLPHPGLDPEAALVQEERGQDLARAVRSLPIPYRQVVILTLEELDYTEIAQVLGISESNVGVRLNRARQMLRKIMGGRR